MRFTKMHGLGNDYLYYYGELEHPDKLAVQLSDRHFGIGADGIIQITPSDIADFKMRIFNADGSEARMCGNGIRCVGKYVYEKGYTKKESMEIETLSGIRFLQLAVWENEVKSITVDMGKANVGKYVYEKGYTKKESMEIETLSGIRFLQLAVWENEVKSITVDMGKAKVEVPVTLMAAGEAITCTPVSVGNPHAVIFVRDAEHAPLDRIGPEIEKNPYFPNGVNVEFAEQIERNALRMRVWERGSGITMACGTGACATTAAAVVAGMCPMGEEIIVELDGGKLRIKVKEDYTIVMTGTADTICECEV